MKKVIPCWDNLYIMAKTIQNGGGCMTYWAFQRKYYPEMHHVH